MRLITIVASASALVAAMAACSSSSVAVTGPADAGDDSVAADAADGGTSLLSQTCATSSESDVCVKCAYEHCCDSRARIHSSAAGEALIDCIAPGLPDGAPVACDSRCQAGCFEGSPDQTTPYLEHYTCLLHHCAEQCGDPTRPSAIRCGLCGEAKCLDDSLACNLSRDCFVYATCTAECLDDDTCVAACAATHPEGKRLRTAVVLCEATLCARECADE